MKKRVHLCPQCGSENVRRAVRKSIIENVLFRLFAISPYRCSVCDKRFVDTVTGGATSQLRNY